MNILLYRWIDRQITLILILSMAGWQKLVGYIYRKEPGTQRKNIKILR